MQPLKSVLLCLMALCAALFCRVGLMDTPQTVPGGSGDTPPILEMDWRAVNSWDSGEEHFTQYELTIAPNARVNEWDFWAAAQGEVTVTQSWSCDLTQEGNKVFIKPVEYNTTIPAFEKITIGVIAKGDELTAGGFYADTEGGIVGSIGPAAPSVAPSVTPTAPSVTPSVTPNSPSVTPYPPSADTALSPLHVEGTHLVNTAGETVRLRGVSTHGLAWFGEYVNEDAFRTIKEDWGANAVRLALYTAEYGGYCNGGNQEKLKELVDKGVEYATNQGLYVIIDWHILSDGNPRTHQDEAVKFFDEISRKYAEHSNVLYEICNEPQNSPWKTVIKPYAETLVETIRANDPDGVIIVGTNTWSQDVEEVIGNRLNDENVVYSFHFYSATHKTTYRQKVKNAVKAGVPVFVSECGLCDASGSGGVDEASAKEWFKLLKEENISFMAWSLCNKNETASLLRSDCAKLGGWTEADLSQSGKLFRAAILDK